MNTSLVTDTTYQDTGLVFGTVYYLGSGYYGLSAKILAIIWGVETKFLKLMLSAIHNDSSAPAPPAEL